MANSKLPNERATKERAELTWVERFASHRAKCDPNDPVCSSCLEWYGENYATRHAAGPMLPPTCALSTTHQVQASVKQPWWTQLSDRDQVEYQVATDPVMWASTRLRQHASPDNNWVPETYQIAPLRCTAQKMLLLFGRQSGKCLSSGNISTYDGRLVPVVDLVDTTFDVISLAGTRIVPRRATVTKNIVKPCVRVTFTSGRSLEVSTDHPFKAFDRWIDAVALKHGDRIASIGKGVFGTKPIPNEEAEILGLATGDGGLTGSCFLFTNINPTILNRLRVLADLYDCDLVQRKGVPTYAVKTRGGANDAISILREHGVMGKLAKHKAVPIAIQQAPKQAVALFINRLFACDGWAHAGKYGKAEIGYCSASKDLALGVQDLLLKFGIFSIVYEKFPKCGEKRFHAWQLIIAGGANIRKFADEINILGKEEAVAKVVVAIRPPVDNERSIADTLPKEARLLAKQALKGRPEYIILPDGPRIWRDRGLSKRVAAHFVDTLGAKELGVWLDSDVLWDEVKSVESIGDQQTYSVSILDTDNYDDQNFAANGIFTHNTEVLCAKILNRMDTRPGYKIVCVVPFLAQASDIYARLLAFTSVSPDLKNRVERQRESPIHEITFDNNSRIRIFTAGERTGKGAADVRGQSADWLVLDEAAMLSDNTLVAIMATLTRAKVPEIWVSSTPLEAVGRFYSWATDPLEGFRVFWCPSSNAPEWTDETEMFYRRTYSKAHYAREYEARFGHAEHGVFRSQDLAAPGVIDDYDIFNPVPDHTNEIYIIGVDWNSCGTGVVILVYAWSNALRKFIVRAKEIVDPEDFTQVVAIDRIVQLNAIWKPKYIYVDAGFGNTQCEVLRRYGIDHPETGLARKIKPIAMNSPIEIRDPLTKSKVKKQAKNLLVEMARARLETQQCVFPRSEDHKDGLVGQIRAYQVLRTTATGVKIFSQGNEHLLTAWLLALGGFIIEFTDLTRANLATDVVKMDPDLNLIKKVRTQADKAKAIEERHRMEQPSRTSPARTLSVQDALKYAGTGLPEGLKRKLNNASSSAPTRKTWR